MLCVKIVNSVFNALLINIKCYKSKAARDSNLPTVISLSVHYYSVRFYLTDIVHTGLNHSTMNQRLV